MATCGRKTASWRHALSTAIRRTSNRWQESATQADSEFYWCPRSCSRPRRATFNGKLRHARDARAEADASIARLPTLVESAAMEPGEPAFGSGQTGAKRHLELAPGSSLLLYRNGLPARSKERPGSTRRHPGPSRFNRGRGNTRQPCSPALRPWRTSLQCEVRARGAVRMDCRRP